MSQPTASRFDLVFVGYGKHVVAIDRITGRTRWSWKVPKGHGNFNVMLVDDDQLIVCNNGHTWALELISGGVLWYNPLKEAGYSGMPTIASTRAADNAALYANHAAVMATADGGGGDGGGD